MDTDLSARIWLIGNVLLKNLALIAYYFFEYDYSTVLTPYPLCEY